MKKILLALALTLSGIVHAMNVSVSLDKSFVNHVHIEYHVRNGLLDLVTKGLDAGISADAKCMHNYTLIEVAINWNRKDIAQLLFDRGAQKPTNLGDKNHKALFDEVVSWYPVVAPKPAPGSAPAATVQTSWKTHLPKIGAFLGTATILVVAATYLNKYLQKKQDQKKEQSQEKSA